MITVDVALPLKPYTIYIKADLSYEIKAILETCSSKGKKSVVITDQGFSKAQEAFLNKTFNEIPMLVLPQGEQTKSLDTATRIYKFLTENALDRSSTLFAVGGGVIGDVSGFCAATFLRGICFYQVPTTLMAMVDSSVGGKNAVNLQDGKNLVGTFHQPEAVYIDTQFLKTLPPREFNAGMAEVIKYGLLADAQLFETLEKNPPFSPQSTNIEEIVQTACLIKAQIVANDEKDLTGPRALLNLGHSFGHAIEAVSHYTEYLHGEAVAIGTLIAARLSVILGYITEDDLSRIRKVFEKYELPTALKTPLKISLLNQALHRDKKVRAGMLNFIILEKIGKALLYPKAEEKWLHLLWSEVNAID